MDSKDTEHTWPLSQKVLLDGAASELLFILVMERDTLTSTYGLYIHIHTHTHPCANRRQSVRVCNRLILETWRAYEPRDKRKILGCGTRNSGLSPSSAASSCMTLGRSSDSLSPSSPKIKPR